MSELDDLEEINLRPDKVLSKRTTAKARHAYQNKMSRGAKKLGNKLRRAQYSSIFNRKITPAQRIAIRTDPRPTEVISIEYGISDDYVRDIRQGKFG